MRHATLARGSDKYRQEDAQNKRLAAYREPFVKLSTVLKSRDQLDLAANNFTGSFAGPWPIVVIHGSTGPAGSQRSTCSTIAPSNASASSSASTRPTHACTPYPQPTWPRFWRLMS